MKYSIKKLVTIEVIMLFVIILNFFQPFLFEHYKYLIFLLLMGIFVYFTIGIDTSRAPESKPILKNILIFLMCFFLFIYLSGLFIGFAKTIYSWSLTNLVKNILPTVTIIIVTEILRYQFIKKSNNNLIVIILSCITFILLDTCIGFYNYNLMMKDQIYEYIGIIILGSITRNIFMSILDVKTDFINPLVYRLIMELYIYIVPIVPDFGPYINSVILIVIPIVLSVLVLKNKFKKIEKPKDRKKTNIIFSIVLVILLILVGLNSGFFKYQSLVIGSNSMYPYITKGDVVIIDKLNDEQKKNLKVGDILIFRHDGKIISHRIHKIVERPDAVYYVTKGDNNSQADAGVVEIKNIIGIVKLKIEKVGLPSIWLNELFQ